MKSPRKFAPPSPEVMERFAAVAGAENVLSDPEDMRPYLREWRDRYVGRAACVLRPGSEEEVAGLLKIADDAEVAVVPQGGNTGLVGGQIPFEEGNEVVLSLDRMNRILRVDPEDDSITLEAGVILADAQRAAEEAGRLFPLSLAAEGSCRIGGNLATNAGGVNVIAYGTARAQTARTARPGRDMGVRVEIGMLLPREDLFERFEIGRIMAQPEILVARLTRLDDGQLHLVDQSAHRLEPPRTLAMMRPGIVTEAILVGDRDETAHEALQRRGVSGL